MELRTLMFRWNKEQIMVEFWADGTIQAIRREHPSDIWSPPFSLDQDDDLSNPVAGWTIEHHDVPPMFEAIGVLEVTDETFTPDEEPDAHLDAEYESRFEIEEPDRDI